MSLEYCAFLGLQDMMEDSVLMLQTSCKSQQDMGSECRRLLILAGVLKSPLYSHYKGNLHEDCCKLCSSGSYFLWWFPPFLKKERTIQTNLFSVGHTSINYAYLLCIFQLFFWTFLGSGSPFLLVNPVHSVILVIWEAPAYLKAMASFVFPSSYWITRWCTSDIPSSRLMKAPFFFVQVVLRQKFLHTHTSSSYLIDTLRHHAWNMLLFTYLCL